MNENQLDFVAVGDITTDAFIRLSGDEVEIKKLEGHKQHICFNFGDKIEYDKLNDIPAVCNSPNAAVSAHRLKLNSALETNLGDDFHGKECVEKLKNEGIIMDFVNIHKNQKSNYHFVLWYEEERTILVKHQRYNYKLSNFPTPPKWFYFSSVGKDSLEYHNEIANYLEKNETKLAFQPGTLQMKMGLKKLKKIYEQTEVFFCNKQEAKRILETEEDDIKELMKEMRSYGPKIVVITDGPNGANADDGENVWHIPMYPDPAPPVDRTGAGDAFSSTFISALILGKDISEALVWGPINSMSVVQGVGAQEGLLTREKLEEFLANAPDYYRATKI